MDVLSYSASPLTISSIHRTTFPPGGQKMQQVLWGKGVRNYERAAVSETGPLVLSSK
jgi:hypothetical protein